MVKIMFSNPQDNIRQFNVGKSTMVVDFGSGSGAYAFALAEAVGEHGKVYAIDVQKDLLQKLKNEAQRRHLRNIETVWSDLDHLGGTKLRDNSIDSIIASNVFFQISGKDNAALEIKRILKPNGRLLVIDWTDSFGGMGPEPKSVFTEDDARKIFSTAGLSEDGDIDAGSHHYGIIFRKK
jgi:ubiquinone/menaquinone biosynthesis C-methylase UbiE